MPGPQHPTLLAHRLLGSTSSRTCLLSRQSRSLQHEAMRSVAQARTDSARGGSIDHQAGMRPTMTAQRRAPSEQPESPISHLGSAARHGPDAVVGTHLDFFSVRFTSPGNLADRHWTKCQRHGVAAAVEEKHVRVLHAIPARTGRPGHTTRTFWQAVAA